MTSSNADKRDESETLLKEVFALMEYPAKLEFKDLADGALGVAVHFDGELPGIAPGKRSPVLDSVQFWLNKVVNRPNSPRRWVNLGNGEFPIPRQQQGQPSEAAPVAAGVPAAKPTREAKPAREAKVEKEKKPAPAPSAPPPQRHGKHVDERSLKPAADAAMSAAGKLLAEKSAKHGRVYAVLGLSNDQRALMLQASDAVKGQHSKAEGEGHWRRVTVTPEKLTVISRKQVMPDYDDEDEDE
jgi:predicted RNA-binding protein Jag